MKKGTNRAFVALICLLSFIGWGSVKTFYSTQIDRHVLQHLKLAADAGDIALAKEQLTLALENARYYGLDRPGFTSLVLTVPSDDVGFWYKNTQSALTTVTALREDSPDKQMALLKLRQILLDHNKDGEGVTYPDGISAYPYNRLFCIWLWLSVFGFLYGVLTPAIAAWQRAS